MPITCLECRKLAPFTCAGHPPEIRTIKLTPERAAEIRARLNASPFALVTRRPARWTPEAPALPPVPKSRAAAATLRANAVEQRDAMRRAGFTGADVVALAAAIGFYDGLLAADAWPVASDDGDDDATADPAS